MSTQMSAGSCRSSTISKCVIITNCLFLQCLGMKDVKNYLNFNKNPARV